MFASRIRTSENSSTTAVRGPQCRRRPPRRRREASPDPVRTYHRSRRRGAHRTRRARRRDLRRRPLLHPRRRSTPFFGMDRRKGSTSRPRTRARGPGRPPGRVRGRLPWATAEPILLGGPSTAGTAVLRYCIRSKSDKSKCTEPTRARKRTGMCGVLRSIFSAPAARQGRLPAGGVARTPPAGRFSPAARAPGAHSLLDFIYLPGLRVPRRARRDSPVVRR